MLWLLMLAACGLLRGGGGTAVGNPGKAVIRLGPPADGDWVEVVATTGDMVLTNCAETVTEVVEIDTTDLVDGPAVEIPVGTWCALEVRMEGLQAMGDALLEVPTLVAEMDLDSTRFERSNWLVELGEPGAPEAFEDRSGVFRELVADGRLDPLERAAGPEGAGAERTPDDPEPPVLLAVGVDGLRAALTTPESPTYEQLDDRGPFTHAAYVDGRWVVVGGDALGLIGTSDDQGATWRIDERNPPLSAVVAFDGQFIGASASNQLLRSEDGSSWTVEAGDNALWLDLASSPDEVVVVGDGQVGVTDDGLSWTISAPPGAPAFHAVAWGPPGFVAVGEDGERWLSVDGTDWAVSEEGGGKLYTVAWSGTAYVAGGDTNTWRSTDGKAWTALDPKPLERIVYHDGDLYGAVDQQVYRSTDEGDTWELWLQLDKGSMWGLGSNRPFEP